MTGHGCVQVAVGACRDSDPADGARRHMQLLGGGCCRRAVVSGREAMALAELTVACATGVGQVVDVAAGRQGAARSETFDFHGMGGFGKEEEEEGIAVGSGSWARR